MNNVPNHFALFGLAPTFALDPQALDAAYKRVQAQVHPDRFASGTAAERRVAMQWAARANEALQTLRSPARRAAYLCEMHGTRVDTESNTALPAEFLARQLEWREALADADGLQQLQALAGEVNAARQALLDELGQRLDLKRDFDDAAALVRQLMFMDKLRDEIENARHRRDTAAAPWNAG